jgi:hypothetical protein
MSSQLHPQDALALYHSHIEFHFKKSMILHGKDIDVDNNYEFISSGVIHCEKSTFYSNIFKSVFIK